MENQSPEPIEQSEVDVTKSRLVERFRNVNDTISKKMLGDLSLQTVKMDDLDQLYEAARKDLEDYHGGRY